MNSERGVFLYDDPSMDKLKACSFFWESIIVFESYLSDINGDPILTEASKALFRKGVLKICETPANLKADLTDKIYCNLDKDLWEFLYRNADKVAAEPKLPENVEDLVSESTARDAQDVSLCSLVDKVIYTAIEEKWINALHESDRFPYESMPPEMRKAALREVRKLTQIEYDQYLQRKSKTRFSFEHRNRYLLDQMTVANSLFTPLAWLPYYKYKLGDYSLRDARKYIKGLNAVLPFVKRKSISSFSIDEILSIRRNRRWNNAMVRLSELCNDAKVSYENKKFLAEMEQKVIFEYQNALGEEETTVKDLNVQLAKGSVLAGISFVPIIGTVVSTMAGLVDPIVTYLWKEGKQRSLPFFLNDIRKLGA